MPSIRLLVTTNPVALSPSAECFNSLLEVALVVGSVIKLFRLRAKETVNHARAGVSTHPRDGVLVELSPRG